MSEKKDFWYIPEEYENEFCSTNFIENVECSPSNDRITFTLDLSVENDGGIDAFDFMNMMRGIGVVESCGLMLDNLDEMRNLTDEEQRELRVKVVKSFQELKKNKEKLREL